jgi:hypothetical protein
MYSSNSQSSSGSTTIHIDHLEPFAEPAFVRRMFRTNEFRERLLEIECPSWNPYGSAYITFSDKTTAEAAVARYNDHYSSVRGQKLHAQIVIDHVQDPENKFLSQYLEDEKAYEGVRTSTVRIEGLPLEHTMRSLNKLVFDEFIETYYPNVNEMPNVLHAHVEGDWTGTALVQFGDEYDAVHTKDLYNGMYWKNAVIYVHCVPDSEMEDLLEQKRVSKAAGKQIGFWVGNLKVGVTQEEIREMFNPFKLNDINIPSVKEGQPQFLFVFMGQDDATAFHHLHPKGFKHRGRWVKVNLMKVKGKVPDLPKPAESSSGTTSQMAEKGKPVGNQNSGGLSQSATSSAFPPGPTDVRVDNLAYSANKGQIRDFFKDFKITKVVLKQGFAWVGFDTLEDARRATQRLNGKKVLGRPVTIKVVGPPPRKP